MNKKEKNVEFLGQVFTSDEIVQQMLKLKKHNGNILEPSCGDGAFFNILKKTILEHEVVGVEFDSSVCPETAINIDFFDYHLDNKFDTIIGNPPYVKHKKINVSTKTKLDFSLFDERSNLYLFFIEKSIKHLKENGELIFIVPRDFIKASSGVNLNKWIYSQGTITDWIDFGDKILFPGFAPNCVIFRFQKDNFSRKTLIDNKEYTFKEMNGQIIFTKNDYPISFADLFFVKVGGVSGCDEIFNHPNGNKEFVYSLTRETGKTKKMFYNIDANELIAHKTLLLDRKIRKFTEKNWFMWGRNYYESILPRIYINAKTRKIDPFFIHVCNAFDGSILGIFPKFEIEENRLKELCEDLNQVDWNELGFICDGRYLFSQRSLEQTMLPIEFNKYFK